MRSVVPLKSPTLLGLNDVGEDGNYSFGLKSEQTENEKSMAGMALAEAVRGDLDFRISWFLIAHTKKFQRDVQ